MTFEGHEVVSHLDVWGEVVAGGVNTRAQVCPWPLEPETRQGPLGSGEFGGEAAHDGAQGPLT